MKWLALGIILTVACSKEEQPKVEVVKEKIVPVEVHTIAPKTLSNIEVFIGTLEAKENAILNAPSGGKVKQTKVEPGDPVSKGQNLCNIEADKAKIMFEMAKLNEKIALDRKKRTELHLKRGTSSRTKLEQDTLAYLKARKELLDAKKVFNGAKCTSPLQGTVIEKFVDLHQEVAPGGMTYRVANLDKMKVNVPIAENAYMGISTGAQATLTSTNFPERTWQGTVSSVSKGAHLQNKTFDLEIVFDNKDKTLLPGLTVNVAVKKDEFKNVIAVDSRHVQIQNDKKYVHIVSSSGDKAKRVPVTIAHLINNRMIIAKGLNAGDTLITSGSDLMVDGQKIKIITEKKNK